VPLIVEGNIAQAGVIQASNPAGFGVTGLGAGAGIFGTGQAAGVQGDGNVTGVIGNAKISASTGGLFTSIGLQGFGVRGVVTNTSIPGTGVQGTAPNAFFVPPGQLIFVPGIGISGSGYHGLVGTGRNVLTPGIDTFFGTPTLQGTGVRGEGYIGVYGKSANGIAGYFDGTVQVTGDLSALTLSQSSDRSLKSNFAPVDGRGLLRRLGQMPIQAWTYKREDAGVRHIGPTAQDFYQAFGLGADDRHIATVDESGIALAAIQSMYELQREQEDQTKELRAVIESLQAEVTRLRRELGR